LPLERPARSPDTRLGKYQRWQSSKTSEGVSSNGGVSGLYWDAGNAVFDAQSTLHRNDQVLVGLHFSRATQVGAAQGNVMPVCLG